MALYCYSGLQRNVQICEGLLIFYYFWTTTGSCPGNIKQISYLLDKGSFLITNFKG